MATKAPWAYNGNVKVKKAGYPMRLDEHRKEEIKKCKEDLVYFIRNYVHIRSIDHGMMKFDMHPFQEELVNVIDQNKYTLITCARQVGKTTVMMAYMAWYGIFHSRKNVAILANKGKTAFGIMHKFKEIYSGIPLWMQQGVVEWNKSSIEFENGTIVYTAATSGDAVRGDSISLCMIDEAAFVKENLWQEFWDSTLPTISSAKSSKLVLISTPNGMNHYEELYRKANILNAEGKPSNGFASFDVPWYEVPGRDEKWKQEQISKTSVSRFMQEHELSFLGSEDTLISVETLSKITRRDPIETKWEEKYRCYKKPEDGTQYVVTVDVSHGVGLDSSVVSVFDVSNPEKFEHVAVYQDNTLTHTQLPDIIYFICLHYNNALLVIENNEIGQLVAYQMVYELEYDNLYTPDSYDDAGGVLNLGVRTTKTTKRIGCNNLKSLLEKSKLDVYDEALCRELSNFAKTKTGNSYAAKYGHDDIVMTLVIFSWLTKQKNFTEEIGFDLISTIDGEVKMEHLDEMEIDLPTGVSPADIFVSGFDDSLGF